jgi:uncharacterized tellurite resistance protein B-like protein
MGLFDFFSNNSVDDQKVEVILGLMGLIMNADNQVSESENLYIINYIHGLNLSESKRKKLISKLTNQDMSTVMEKAKNLTTDDKNELINELMSLGNIDGKLDKDEWFMIASIAHNIGFDPTGVTDFIIENFGLTNEEIDEKIKSVNDNSSNSPSESKLERNPIGFRASAESNKSSEKSTEDNPDVKKFCPECGSNQEGNTYCTDCGNKL